MQLGSFKFIHIVRLEASPAVVRLLERIAGPPSDLERRLEEFMATTRELLDGLRAGIERKERLEATIERMEQEKRDHALQDEARDREEEEEDRLEAEEDLTHEEAIRQRDEQIAADRQRIAELESRRTLDATEEEELATLIERLNRSPAPPEVDPNPPGPGPVE